MGHYRADLACDDCGNVRCTCPPKKVKTEKGFIVTTDWRVVTVAEFDADPANNVVKMRYGDIPTNPVLKRLGSEIFKKRENAEAHAREMLELEVEKTRARLAGLKKLLKVTRPWEQK